MRCCASRSVVPSASSTSSTSRDHGTWRTDARVSSDSMRSTSVSSASSSSGRCLLTRSSDARSLARSYGSCRPSRFSTRIGGGATCSSVVKRCLQLEHTRRRRKAWRAGLVSETVVSPPQFGHCTPKSYQPWCGGAKTPLDLAATPAFGRAGRAGGVLEPVDDAPGRRRDGLGESPGWDRHLGHLVAPHLEHPAVEAVG